MTPVNYKAHARRVIAGHKAKRFGALFESMFQLQCRRQHVAVTRMPDGCKMAGPKKIVRVKTPWDWVITHDGATALIDTKTIDAKSFAVSKIEEHQVLPMVDHVNQGGQAGYVIWSRPEDAVYFVTAFCLNLLRQRPGSIGPRDPLAIYLGTSEKFDVTRLFEPHTRLHHRSVENTK